MRPTAIQVREALRFLTDVPALARDGRLDPGLCVRGVETATLASLAEQLGYAVDAAAIAEAFRFRMLARLAVQRRKG